MALDAAIEAFASDFFNNMVLVLDNYFCRQGRTEELKDGNPLDAVRMLCNSIISNNNKMGADETIKYHPAKSVLKHKIGDAIRVIQFVPLKDRLAVLTGSLAPVDSTRP